MRYYLIMANGCKTFSKNYPFAHAVLIAVANSDESEMRDFELTKLPLKTYEFET